MIPAPKQRWLFKSSFENWLAEVISADTSCVKVKLLWTSSFSTRMAGQVYESAGLADIFKGRNDPYWTYLEGQEAP